MESVELFVHPRALGTVRLERGEGYRHWFRGYSSLMSMPYDDPYKDRGIIVADY